MTRQAEQAEATKQRNIKVIRAHVQSDDGRMDVEFNARPWFEAASDEDIKRLIAVGFGEGFAADVVYKDHPLPTEDMNKLTNYLEVAGVGFEVQVNKEDALNWLKKHRPGILEEIESVEVPGAKVEVATDDPMPVFDEPSRCEKCGSEAPMALVSMSITEGPGPAQFVPGWVCPDCGHAHLTPVEEPVPLPLADRLDSAKESLKFAEQFVKSAEGLLSTDSPFAGTSGAAQFQDLKNSLQQAKAQLEQLQKDIAEIQTGDQK